MCFFIQYVVEYLLKKEELMGSQQETTTAASIHALAERHNVVYAKTQADVWASHVTRLADDNVELDPVELLLIALLREGHLSRPEALKLQVNYLREARL
jgi:hypothetical protein